jgi:C_GCAxxG_C_C family probable redox protein
LAVAESQWIQSDLLPMIATGFCSGVSRTGGFCGALSGAIMGLGLLTGRKEPGASVDENYTYVQELIEQFEKKFGSSNCRELTGVHLGMPEGQAEFRAKNQIKNCLNYAEEATRIVLSFVEEKD